MYVDREKQRVYPTSCTSGFCGKYGADCEGCKYKSELDEFKAWVKRTGAKPSDPIWSPLVYEVPEKQ